MNWFTSLFSSSTQNSRRGQAMSSTHDAFSLPTSSPIFSSHPETPDPETATTASFSYPPSGPGSYGYVPTSAGLGSRPSSLLPMHHDALHSSLRPSSSYPPLVSSWNRIKAWLSREYPELGDTLNYGILPQDLAQIEMQFGFALPVVVRESYLAVDGQEPESSAGCSEGLFFGLTLLPLEDVYEEWRFWREVDDDPATGANVRLRESMQSIPPNWIRKEYSQRGWIPLIADKAGNYVGIDLNPGESGSQGQVIVFGRDFDTKVVLYNGDGLSGWAKWLAAFADELESGEGFEVGPSEGSEGSEDDIGYESYFHDGNGATGDGGGDGSSGGGLRLSGEYRGWNVLEAWADRSVRRWYDAGVISQLDDEQDINASEHGKGKAPERIPLNVLEVTQDVAAEVPIPVLADVGGEVPPAPATRSTPPVTASNPRKPHLNLPTISVTKPPAPLPVELPTPRDIVSLPSPPDSTHSSFDEDLEAGRGRGMRQISREQDASFVSSRRSTDPLRQDSDPLGSITSVSLTEPAPLLPASPPQTIARMPSPPPDIPDLLADSAPELETTPIEPAPSPSRTAAPAILVEPTKAEADGKQEPPATVDDVDPDVTIRLVGGGGKVGTAAEEEQESVLDGAESDASSMMSGPSEAGVTSDAKKHKKTKSGLAGLKKSLGGLRKKDSVSSAKDVVPDSN